MPLASPAKYGELKAVRASPSKRIVHLTDHYSKEAGGITVVIDQLSRRLTQHCIGSEIISVRGNTMPPAPGVQVTDIPPVWIGRPWGWSPQLARKLAEIIHDPSMVVFHVHGVWMAPQYLAAKLATRWDLPFIVSTHGQLAPWLWDSQGLRKKIKKSVYWSLIASGIFKKTGLIHAVTQMERDYMRPLFPNCRIEVIPHAIDVLAIDREAGSLAANPEPLIVFLGRIHPSKGIEILLDGFARAGLPPDWRLVIAGPQWSPAYAIAMQNRATRLGISTRVEFLGPIYGSQKWHLLKRAWVVTVPSQSEVMAMVNLEAAACGTPTITTPETGLLGWEEGGGMLISHQAEEMAKALKQASSWTTAERMSRGSASRRMIEKKYTWEVVLPLWKACYESVL